MKIESENSKNSFLYAENSYNTSSPKEVVPFITHLLNVKSVLDVGCGNGTWLNVFLQHGISDIFGLDSSNLKQDQLYVDKKYIKNIDLAKSFNLKRKFDLVLCLEVAEHLPPKSAKTLIESLVNHSEIIVFSAAIIGQGGFNHLNEQEIFYWIDIFKNFGYKAYDPFRTKFWNNSKINWWYRQNIILYSKINYNLPEFNQFYIHPECYYNKIKEMQTQYDDLKLQSLSLSYNWKNIKSRIFKY